MLGGERDAFQQCEIELSRRSKAVAPALLALAVLGAVAPPVCAHRLAPGRAVGAKIMTGMSGTMPSRSLLARIGAGQVGGVILFADNVSGRLRAATAALQRAARRAGDPPLLIATDQEGGAVKRLPGAPPFRAPSQMSRADAARAAPATARALRRAGINTDLAPVADISYRGDFLGSRTFSDSPGRVAHDACTFARGLQRSGVNATFKHFPGLGAALTDTDTTPTTITLSRRRLISDLAPYRRCQPRLVMISNARYPTLGANVPAVFSRRILSGLLRRTLSFHGVTISDTMSAPGVEMPGAAVRASAAGVDMLLFPSERSSARAFHALLAAVRQGKLSRRLVERSALRIRALSAAAPGTARARAAASAAAP